METEKKVESLKEENYRLRNDLIEGLKGKIEKKSGINEDKLKKKE